MAAGAAAGGGEHRRLHTTERAVDHVEGGGDGEPTPFFIFIFKKTKFQKYIPNRKIFKKGACRPLMGDRVPVAHPVADRT